MEFFAYHAGQIGGSIVMVSVAFFCLFGMKWLTDRATPFDDRAEIEDKGNLAVALRHVGLLLGLGFALMGPLNGVSHGFWRDFGYMIYEGAAVVALLTIAVYIGDHLILPRINNNLAILNGNVAVGIVELGSSVATGLIAGGSFSGEGGGLLNALVFFALGQAVLVIASKICALFFKFDTVYQVDHGNVAAAVLFSGFLVAMGIVLGASLTGPSRGWFEDGIGFLIYAGTGTFFVLLGAWAADRFFMPKTTIAEAVEKQKNVASALLATTPMIVTAIIVATGVL